METGQLLTNTDPQKSDCSDYRRFLLDELPKQSVGCELGVWKGDFSTEILQIVKPRKLYLIDPWLYQPEFPNSWYGGKAAKTQKDMDAVYQGVKQLFSENDSVQIIRKKTEELSGEIPVGSLDWVYIDGNHQYEYVLEDLRTFFPLVKEGGIICGDDYDRGAGEPFPITQAVSAFLKEYPCQFLWVKKNQFFLRKSVCSRERIEQLLLSGQLETAYAECTALRKQSPEDAYLCSCLGRILLMQNKQADAVIFFGTAFKLDPALPDAALHYFMTADAAGALEAFARFLFNHLDDAIRLFESRTVKRYPAACLNTALEAALAVAQADSANWKAYWVAALIAEKLGHAELAVQACQQVLALNKEFWFARELPKHMRGYYSQMGQDAFIERYFAERKPRSRTFVEVGAFDGRHYSNVRRLVEQHGWKGLSIEPVGKNYRKLVESYAGANVTCIQAAVSNHSGTAEMNVSTYPHLPEWGSDVSSLDSAENERWTRKYQAEWVKETVCLKTLTEILSEQKIPEVGLLSVDAEGHDLEVLEGLDFSKYKPELIVVEYGDKRQEIIRLLSSSGYSLVYDNGQDLFFGDIQPQAEGFKTLNVSGSEQVPPYAQLQTDVEQNFAAYTNKKKSDPLLIVVVGAYHGHEIERFLAMYPHVQVMAFEANPATYEIVRQRFAGYPQVHCYNYAVSDRNGMTEFYENNLPGTGSILPVDAAGSNQDGCSVKVAEQYGIKSNCKFTVQSIRLDDFEPLKNKTVDLLWCDVQGAELHVLEGANKVLANCHSLFLEVWCHATLYKDQARLIDLEKLLLRSGFYLAAIGLDTKTGNGSGNGFWLKQRYRAASVRSETVRRIEDIRPQINPHLFQIGYLPDQGEVRVQTMHPSTLIQSRRFDVMAKIIYAKFCSLNLQSPWGQQLYLAHLRCLNGFRESDGSGKADWQQFLRAFHDLIHSFSSEGFNPERSLIPIGDDGTIIDGSHRLALSYLFQKDVEAAVFSRGTNDYGFGYFVNRGFDRAYADAMAYEYVRVKKNTHVVTVFPSAQGKDAEVTEIIGKHADIVYRRDVQLCNHGPHLLIKQMYRGEPWLGDWSNGFKGAKYKASQCFRGTGPVRVFLVETDSPEKLRACKQEIRDLFGVENHSVHINDSYAETVRLSQIFFNQNSVHFLNHAQLNHYENFYRLLDEYEKMLDEHQVIKDCFCVDGSASMAVYGIRAARDIDYFHYGYDDVRYADEAKIGSHNSEIKYHTKTIDDIIFNPTHHFYYEGMKFVSLDVLSAMKARRGEAKDRKDVQLMAPYLQVANKPVEIGAAPAKTKIVGLVGGRNEDRVIGQCLRLLSRFTDAIVFLDDCSTDKTLETVRGLAAECRIERILTKDRWERDEPADRNRMLEAGRQIGGTHFIVLDADEALTSNFLRDDQLTALIRSMQPGDQLLLNWIALWRSTGQYRHDQSVWTNNYKPFIFCDDGQCRYSSDFIHTPRVPANLQKGRVQRLEGYDYGVLHFQFVNWSNLLLKQAWYRCLERIRNPKKPVEQINRLYAPSKDEAGLHLEPSHADWFSGYADFDPGIYDLPDTWRRRQIDGWLAEHGPEYFKGLDIWDIVTPTASGSGSVPESEIAVSAIVSTYNSEAFIRGCLQDLVEQTLYQKGQMEIIVVNSGSEQNEEAIVKAFQSRYPNIQYLRTPRETIYAAWNRGVRAARGKYLTNANTDDRHAPEMLEKLARTLDENPDVSYVYSPFYITEVPNQTWQTKTPVAVSDWQREYSRQSLLERYYCGPQPMWRRSLHDEYGYFDERMQVAGDYEFVLRISQTHKLKLVNEPLGLYYRSEQGLERSAGTHNRERIFSILMYRHFQSSLIRRPLPHPAAEFAVILRNHNNGRYLAETIDSVRRQTFENWELVIVDAGSGGHSVEIADRYLGDPRIRLVVNDGKQEILRPTLAGIPKLSAVVFGELNSGDLLAPNALERMVQAHRQQSECGFIASQQPGAKRGFNTYKLADYLKTGMKVDLNHAQDDEIIAAMKDLTGFYHVPEPLYTAGGDDSFGPAASSPLVSVIIATYNRPESLKYAVTSVLNQTYPNIEIIVVNDAGEPVDGLLASLNMRGNIISLRHDRNQGPAATRNTGLRAARGKYIAYLDDDDIYFPNHVEVLVTALENSPHRFAYTHAQRSHQVKKDGRYVEVGRSYPYTSTVTHDQLLVRNLIPTLCIMHERSCIDDVGYFDESFRTHEDWDMWIRISQRCEPLHIPKLTTQITWRQDGTTTTSRMQEAFMKAPERMYQKHRAAAAGKPAVLALQAERLRLLKGQADGMSSAGVPVSSTAQGQQSVQSAAILCAAASIPPVSSMETRKYKIAVKFCTPSQKLNNWGDTWFARGLQRAFIDAGHDCVMHSREEWDQPDDDIDIAIHLKGLAAYKPKPHCFNVIWLISHPELHTPEELNQFDAVFCGSQKYLEHIQPELKVPIRYLPQAADTTVFKPVAKAAEQDIDLLFVGSNYYQNKNRKIIADVLATGRDYNLWIIGPYWKDHVPDKYVKGQYVLPEKLADLYARTKIVLNDHHDTMRLWGFVNDRTYSLAASNMFQISDDVQGLEELGVVTYQTPEDLREKIDFYLANDAERLQVAASVHERCKGFSFAQVAQRILNGVGEQWAIRAGKRERVSLVPTAASANVTLAPQPKVSVIMSCHNAERYLTETMDTLLAQTLKEWELLAVDDGSTDGTLSMLKSYAEKDSRIRLWQFDEKRGPYLRRNFAIRQSAADFICIQDADDLMHPEKLEALYECIRQNPRLAIVGSHHRRFRQEFRGEDFADPVQRSTNHTEIMEAFKQTWQLCWHGSAIIRKSLFDTIGLYDEQPYGSDTFWLSKAGLYSLITRQVEFRNIPRFLTYKREHSNSQTGTISPADPRNRRHYLEKYYLSKLTEIAQDVVNNPTMDAAAALKACTCTEFIPVFGHMFEKWETEPVTEEMCAKMLERAAAQFSAEYYVSCLITLDRLERMTGSQSAGWRNINMVAGLAAYASGDDHRAAAHLWKETCVSGLHAATALLKRVESGAASNEARQRRQEVRSLVAANQGVIRIEIPSGLSEQPGNCPAGTLPANLPCVTA